MRSCKLPPPFITVAPPSLMQHFFPFGSNDFSTFVCVLLGVLREPPSLVPSYFLVFFSPSSDLFLARLSFLLLTFLLRNVFLFLFSLCLLSSSLLLPSLCFLPSFVLLSSSFLLHPHSCFLLFFLIAYFIFLFLHSSFFFFIFLLISFYVLLLLPTVLSTLSSFLPPAFLSSEVPRSCPLPLRHRHLPPPPYSFIT